MARRWNNRKWIIGGMILVLLIVTGVGAALLWNNEHKETERMGEVAQEELNKDNEMRKQRKSILREWPNRRK